MFKFIRRRFNYAVIDNVVIPDALWSIRVDQEYGNKFIYDAFDIQILVGTYADGGVVNIVETLERLDILNIILECHFGFYLKPNLNNGEVYFSYAVLDEVKFNNYPRQHLYYQWINNSKQSKMRALITTAVFLFLA